MILLDKSYFENADLLIPGLEKETGEEKLNELINKYEPRYMKNILGYGFYKAFSAAVDAGEDGLAQKWTDLRDGAEYTDGCGVLRKWEGFLNEEWKSPIANYVYCHYLRYNASTTTVGGEKESKAASSNGVSSMGKQVAAWNEMVRMNCVLFDFLLNKKDDNGDLVYTDFKTSELTDEFSNLLSYMSYL